MTIGTSDGRYDLVPIPARGIGTRISAALDKLGTRKTAASSLGVSVDSLARYVREDNMPPFDVVARLCLSTGFSMEWLATGIEPPKAAPQMASQAVRPEVVSLAVQLAEEALEGGRLEPADYGQLVALIYDALVNGLPSAQVLAFARPAARGFSRGKEDAAQGMGGSGKGTAGKG
ncbi:helix-turn-helix domain-containing protein [Pseudoxanthomonas mexicana]|uniref:helix-turn-helix domain-containing protein n=1 Tax=Pseudoxanthomonas mexicana TaxID=128785 RepID=UPI00398B8E22